MHLSEQRADNYLKSLIKVASLYKGGIEAVILFGSHARNEASIMSDVDILIVLKKLDRKELNHLKANLRFLEFKFDYVKKPKNILEFLLIFVNIATGMFKSWFVCSLEDLKSLKFDKITNTNFLLGKFFAPYKIILYNIKKDGIVVFGDEKVLQSVPTIRFSNKQIYKSFVLNELISICAIIISPYTKLSINYTLESIKWSIFSANYKLKRKKIINSTLDKYLNLYFNTRTNGKYDKKLILLGPYIIFKLHLLAMKTRID